MIQPSKTTSMGSTDLFCFQLVTHPLSPRDNLRLRPMFFVSGECGCCVDVVWMLTWKTKTTWHSRHGKIKGWCNFLSKVKGFYYLLLLITSSKDASPTCQEHLTQWLVTAILGFPSPVFQHGHRVLHIDTRRLPPVVVSHLFISCLAGILLIPCI